MRAGLRVQEQELCRAQEWQEELLRKLQEAQEREVAMASETQALSSQLEEAWDAQREVSDEGRGQQQGPAPRTSGVAGRRLGSSVQGAGNTKCLCTWPRPERGNR